MKVLVMGCGRAGANVGLTLFREGHEVTIMDPNPQSFLRIPAEFRQRISVQGDGTLEADLRRAGIEGVDVFVALSARDTRNALAAQMAKHTFGIKKVVCRINDPVRQEMYQELGLEVVSPTKLISEMILHAVRH